MTEPLLHLQDVIALRHTEPTGFFGLWGAKPVRALDGVSLTLSRGETLGIMGGSGAGKSTLAEVATLRRAPDRGRVVVQGEDAAKLKKDERRKLQRRLQMIRQDARETLEMDRTVRKQLQDELRQQNLTDAEARIARALEQVGLPAEFMERTPAEMSGGQQQRIAIARALAMGPIMVAADEPVSGVDPHLQLEILRLMEQVQKQQNLAYLLISQDRRVISRLAHRTAILDAGRLYELGPTEQLFTEAKHPYSRLFLGHDAGALPAEEDAVGRVVAGCPFAAHCPVAVERCRQEAPVLREVAPGHAAACHVL